MLKFLKWLVVKLEPKKDIREGFSLSENECMHVTWEPESRENEWCSYCRGCGLKASGSCQA